MSANPHRLPRVALPSRYELRLEPDLADFTFTGRVRIELEIIEPTSTITLNAVDIEIHQTTIATAAGDHRATPTYDASVQRVTLDFAEVLPTGPARMSIDFAGELNDQLHGFYRSHFTDVNGVEQVIASTQFEATDARRAFPCFDEPDLKAVFGVTLVVPEHLTAVSNSAEVSRIGTEGGKVAITFADTIKMSTYLVAVVVGPFEATDPVDVDGVPVRVVAPRGKGHLSAYALECSRFALRYLSDYYGIPYPGDKVDMVAIPDFAFGAMENLGCITYRETALLIDPETATQTELVRVLDVIGHELAHMWFGDLVTMQWWDGIWLNEAFASFMEMKATDAMRPEWKRWLAFGAVERPWAYAVDALEATRPVEFEVMSPDEANEMFDALTYGKGASALRMIEQYLGEEVFREGVGNYLREHAYGNTVTADLWKGLDQASGLPVGRIMDSWILQRGYPRIDVTGSESGIQLSQRRFLLEPDESDQTIWSIPVRLRGSRRGEAFEARTLLEEPEATIDLGGPVDWVIANAGGHGFYRTAYSPELAETIVSRLETFEDLERYTLIDDAWAFVESGDFSVDAYLELARTYRHEPEPSVWQSLLGPLGAVRHGLTGLEAILHHVVADRDLPAFRSLVLELVGPTMERLGWEPRPDDSDLTRRLRGQIVSALGRLADDPAAIDRARRITAEWMVNPRTSDPDVGQAALFIFAAHGTPDDFDRLFRLYRSAPTPQLELKALQAITVFDREDAVDRILEAVHNGSIRSQDAAWVVAGLFSGRSSGSYAWRQVRLGWSGLMDRLPPMTVRRLVEGLPALSQPETAADVARFFAETPLPVASKSLAQNLERMLANARLRDREATVLGRYLGGPDA